MTRLHVILPNDIDDPAMPSGGNHYDRRVLDALAAAGWAVHEHDIHGTWPAPGADTRAELARVLAGLPDGALVLIDGLVGSAVPDVLVPEGDRLRQVILMHMPNAHDGERQVLAVSRAIVSTSHWTGRRLRELYGLPAGRIHVATPGVDPAPPAAGSDEGTRLLCVAAVDHHKGHDILVDALGSTADLAWSCTCVGSLTRAPAFVEELRRQVAGLGIADRLELAGARIGADLAASYAAADLFVLATRGETYGMVVTEALSRGIPVLATAAGGLPDALGRAPDGTVPGLLVPPDDPAALAAALRRWLTEPDLRRDLRRSAALRREALTGWDVTAQQVATALSAVPAGVPA